MTAKGYKGIMVKEGVAEKVRAMAKAKGKTITAFLGEVLETYDTGAPVSDISNKSMMKMEGDLEVMMRGILEEMMR